MKCRTMIEREDGQVYPCGKCYACRMARTRQWMVRCLHENAYWEKSCFVTLTYDEENLPKNGSLDKKVLQLFIKRLRKESDVKIKYFGCGEYGEHFGRPHYHLILFGIGRYDPIWKDTDSHFSWCESWPYGGTDVRDVGVESVGYVAGYIQKKLEGDVVENYGFRQPPFQVQSQGLGLQWALDNEKQLREGNLRLQGVPVSIPRYYVKKLDIDTSVFEDDARREEYDMQVAARLRAYREYDPAKEADVVRRERIQAEKNRIAKRRLQARLNPRSL